MGTLVGRPLATWRCPLRDLVLSGGLRPGVEPVLVSLLDERLDAGPEVVRMLSFRARVAL